MAGFGDGPRTEVGGRRRGTSGPGPRRNASIVALILIAAACGREQSGDGPAIHPPGADKADAGAFPALPDAQPSPDHAWPDVPSGCENSPLREPFTRIVAQPGPDPAGAFTGYVIAAGDLDGVRGADFIVSGEKTALYLNDGSGSFTRKLVYDGPLGLMQAVDLDGDGDQDFVGTRTDPATKMGSLDIIRNDGQGSFMVETVARTELAFYAAVVADIDGDGASDVIVNERPPGSESSPSLSIYAFTQLATTPRRTTVFENTGVPQTGSLVGGDLDGDGDVDLVVLREPERNKYFHHVVWNEGGRFALDPQPLPLLNWAPVVADIDGDGANDLAGGNLLLHNIGQRRFAPIALDDGPSTGTGDAVVAADHDGDGDLDLLLRRRGDVTILRQDSPLRFSKGRRPIPGLPFFEFSFDYGVFQRLAVADVEGDGRLDLLLSDRSHRVHVIPGDLLAASFTWKRPVREVPTGFFPKGLSSADLEGDGDLDLIAIGGGGVVAFANDGHGAFTPSGPFNSPDGRDLYTHFALADMDTTAASMSLPPPNEGGCRSSGIWGTEADTACSPYTRPMPMASTYLR